MKELRQKAVNGVGNPGDDCRSRRYQGACRKAGVWMQYLEIRGGRPLEGEVTVQGSKNAALPVLTACLLGEGPCVIQNCPQIQDVKDTLVILEELGCTVHRDGATVSIWGDQAGNYKIYGPEAARIRSSVLFLGALLGKMKKAVLPWPGGCAIGNRPIDIHLRALSALGAESPAAASGSGRAGSEICGGACGGNGSADSSICGGSSSADSDVCGGSSSADSSVCAGSGSADSSVCGGDGSADSSICGGSGSEFIEMYTNRLRGTRIRLPFPSVGATENVILAAVCAEGETLLENAAQEPEIGELCRFLNYRGAAILQNRDGCIRVKGVHTLHPVTWRLCPDRIAAGTWLLAVAGAGGRADLNDFPVEELAALFPLLNRMGARLHMEKENRRLCITQKQRPAAGFEAETAPYPGFPTDLQSLLMASVVRSSGKTVIHENIFENRFRTADLLGQMGAEIIVCRSTAIIQGVERLHGAELTAPDLRGGAALAAAALQAEGTSKIRGYERIARGYEDLPGVLSRLGADVCLHGETQ